MIRYAEEFLPDVVDEIYDCNVLHFEEVTDDSDKLEFSPNYEAYCTLAEQGILHLVTARDDDNLVGYIVSYVMPHMQHSNTMFAIHEAYFLKREYRKGFAGYKLLKFAEKIVKMYNVEVIMLGVKARHDIKPIMDRLGYVLEEKTYMKILEK